MKIDHGDDSKVFDNIFCYGDACLTRMKEAKNIPAIRTTSYIVSHNIKALAYGGKLKEMPISVDNLAGVYFSKYSGTTILNDFAIPMCLTLLMKKFIEGTFIGKYQNRCCSSCRYKFYNTSVNIMSCMFNKLLCCCPCSKRRANNERRLQLREIWNNQNNFEDKKSL